MKHSGKDAWKILKAFQTQAAKKYHSKRFESKSRKHSQRKLNLKDSAVLARQKRDAFVDVSVLD